MFVHAVYFWLRKDLSAHERAAFDRGVASLKAIPSVRQAHVGVPAPTDRPVIERSYDCALTVIFDDQAAHDAYQADPIHDQFRDNCSGYWEKVLIYDSVEQGSA